MRRVTPIHALILVLITMAAVVTADYALDGGFSRASFQRVGPDSRGEVRIDVSGIAKSEVRFYRFLNSGNQEVRFLIGKDGEGTLQVGFDASENHAAVGRGFRQDGEWLVDNKCDTAVRLSHVNAGGGGCRPVPLAHRLDGTSLVFSESEILRGWRLFH